MQVNHHLQVHKVRMSQWLKFKDYCANIGFALTSLICVIVVINQYASLKGLDPFYRITMPAMCLVFAFITSTINIRLGLIGCIFALPLLPNLTWQIQQYFGYGRILALHNSGLDLLAGLFLGGLINQLYRKKRISVKQTFPWQLGLLMIFLTLSVILAVSRNLHQTDSIFQPSSLIYNLLHFRSIDWHDDYRPLFDWIVFGSAAAVIYVVISALKETSKRNNYIFIPLMISLLIAALVGYRQSKYGMGLSLDQINFRVDQFGYMALGFQHDIHAFAGQMLIGAIGLFGFLYSLNKLSIKLPVVLIITVSWVALFLSKSKSSFALAIFCLLLILITWVFRHSRFFVNLLKASFLFLLLISSVILIFENTSKQYIESFIQFLGVTDLTALNQKLSYRPEVYLAALKFFTFAPILGLGQSEFYRQSANYSLTHSYFLSIDQNGENAHNYFLQTLTETGFVGIAIYSLLMFSPIIEIKNKRTLIPAGVAIGAIFVGNIFAHSMLVRENLFIAAGFIGLMYAWYYSENTSDDNSIISSYFYNYRYLLFTLSAILIALSAREVYNAYRSEPFLKDVQCFRARPLYRDGWTSGIYKVSIPEGAKGVTLDISGTQPYVKKRPLDATLSIIHRDSSVIEQSHYRFDQDGPHRIAINFANDAVADDGEYRAELRLQRCFIPRNLKINEDGRRLGVQIETSTFNY